MTGTKSILIPARFRARDRKEFLRNFEHRTRIQGAKRRSLPVEGVLCCFDLYCYSSLTSLSFLIELNM
jgi:hypothetical protein